MNLPKLTEIDVKKRKVLLRLDLDLSDSELNVGNLRLRSATQTLNYLISREAKIVIIGHRGRPEGKVIESLSLKPVALVLSELTGKEVIFSAGGTPMGQDSDIVLKENLRFNPGEENNDLGFAKELAEAGEVFINEAFGASHRSNKSRE